MKGGLCSLSILLLLLSISDVYAQSPQQETKPSPGSITGRITIADKPVQGVIVVAMRDSESRGALYYLMRARDSQKATTDADGVYTFTNLKPGKYQVYPWALALTGSPKSRRRTDRFLEVGAGEALDKQDFELEPGGVITGRVTDAKGRPVVGQWIMIDTADDDYGARKIAEDITLMMAVLGISRTDDRGIYRLYGMPSGRYYIGLRVGMEMGIGSLSPSFLRMDDAETFHPGVTDKAKATAVEVKAGSETSGIDIRLGLPTPTYIARGRIVDADTGKPVTAATARCRTTSDPNSSVNYRTPQGGEVDTNGQFQLKDLPAGQYQAYAVFDESSNYYSETAPFEINQSHASGITIKVHRGQRVSGVVVIEGSTRISSQASFQHLPLSAFCRSSAAVERHDLRVKPAADGSFQLSGVYPGTLYFSLEHHFSQTPYRLLRVERNGIRIDESLEISPGSDVAGIRLVVGEASGAIRGQIRMADDSPLQKERLFIVADPIGDDKSGTQGRAGVDEHGSFKVTDLLAGEYELTVYVSLPDPVDTSRPRLKLSDYPVRARQHVTVTLDSEAIVTFTIPADK